MRQTHFKHIYYNSARELLLMREIYSLEAITQTINHGAAVQGLDVVRLLPQSLLEFQAVQVQQGPRRSS